MSYIHSRTLLRRAHAELDAAHVQTSPGEQFIHAHMAALRAAAAVLALEAPGPTPKRRKLRSAWEQLAELGEPWQPWATYYSASAQTRAAVESGQLRRMEPDQARHSVQVAGQFLTAVEAYVNDHEQRFAALAHAS